MAFITDGKEALRIGIVLNNLEENSDSNNTQFDVLVKVQMNCLQCVFINEFVMDVLVSYCAFDESVFSASFLLEK